MKTFLIITRVGLSLMLFIFSLFVLFPEDIMILFTFLGGSLVIGLVTWILIANLSDDSKHIKT